MKQLLLIPFLFGISMAISFKNSGNGSDISKADAAPNIELVKIEPVDAANNLYYMLCAARSSNAKPSGQLSTSFTIRNKESKTLTVTSINYTYISNGTPVIRLMSLDEDKPAIKEINIPAGNNFSWQNNRNYHKVDNALLMETPIPSSITININFKGYSTPFKIVKNLRSYNNQVAGGAYIFPGKESDLRMDEYWYAYGGHGGGSQFYAYDFKAEGWDSDRKRWSNVLPGTDGTENDHYRAYGKDVISVCDGTVVEFNDGVAENKGNGGGGSGGGNSFKINNGKETVCYFHMQPGSLTKAFKKIGAKVKKGDKLGLLGNSGSSSEPHGHIQVIDDPDGDGQGYTMPLNFSSIYIIDKNLISEPDPNAAWTKVTKMGLPFQQDRRCMVWPSAKKPCWYPSGKSEVAKHAIPENKYQAEFSKIWSCGYYPVWVDAYDVAGKTYFNTVFRYNSNNYAVAVKHNMTATTYQQEYNNWVKNKGYRLQQLDNYLDGGSLKFAAIFIKKPGQAQAQPAYHGVSPEQHQDLFEKYTGQGFVPVNVSVTSVGGKRYYSAFYEKRNVGGSMLKSFLSQQEYQDMFDDMSKKNWEQVYINAYHHAGQTRFSVIWYKNAGFSSQSAVRKSSIEGYQDKWEANTSKGLLTRCVTGYDEGGKHWFAAHWAK